MGLWDMAFGFVALRLALVSVALRLALVSVALRLALFLGSAAWSLVICSSSDDTRSTCLRLPGCFFCFLVGVLDVDLDADSSSFCFLVEVLDVDLGFVP